MENTPTPFDLNHAIEHWRAGLGESPAIRHENLNELEAHLRDSIASLRQRGLGEDEAFLIATRRAGGGAALGAEFGKINSREVWLSRVMWMLVGAQAIAFIHALEFGFVTTTQMLMLKFLDSHMFGLHAPAEYGLLSGCLHLLTFGLMLASVWQLITRKYKGMSNWLRRVLSSSSRSVLVLVISLAALSQLLSMAIHLGGQILLGRYTPVQNHEYLVGMSFGMTVASILESVGLIVFALLLARRQLLAKTWA